jgi:hypothetical protein
MQTSVFSDFFFRGTQDDADIVEFPLDRQKNKTGDIWHVSVEVVSFSSDTILPLEISTLFFFLDTLLWTDIHRTRTKIFFLMYIFCYVHMFFKCMFHLIKTTCIWEGPYLM